jgi:hypothetical protein
MTRRPVHSFWPRRWPPVNNHRGRLWAFDVILSNVHDAPLRAGGAGNRHPKLRSNERSEACPPTTAIMGPNYAARRSEFAKQIGLGRRAGTCPRIICHQGRWTEQCWPGSLHPDSGSWQSARGRSAFAEPCRAESQRTSDAAEADGHLLNPSARGIPYSHDSIYDWRWP